MDGVSLVLNVVVLIWLGLGLLCLVCWYVPQLSRVVYGEVALTWFLIVTVVIVALMGLMRFVRMEE